jgi:dipeptidyl aminopeptidase/acylaminoacyl peptidase
MAQLTSFGGPHTHAPSWSPDGRLIAFASLASGNGDIYVIGADGGSPRRLTSDPSAELEPRWSMDGRSIYFSSDRTGRREVWKMPAAGGAGVQLTQGGGQNPAESADGRTVYYLRGQRPETAVIGAGGFMFQHFEKRLGEWRGRQLSSHYCARSYIDTKHQRFLIARPTANWRHRRSSIGHTEATRISRFGYMELTLNWPAF